MKATTLLQNQHRQVETLFEAIEKGDAEKRLQLVNELATALAAHMVIEEETFYPMTINVSPRLVLEAREEHDLAAIGLERAVTCEQDDQLLIARLRVLKEAIEHHVEEEEEELFPAVEKAFDDAQLQAMGQQMQSRFEQLIKLAPQAVLSARPTAGVQCPGRPQSIEQPPGKQQPGKQQLGEQPNPQQPGQQQPNEQPGQQQPGQQPNQEQPGQQQPVEQQPNPQQPGQQQSGEQQPNPQQPGQRPGQPQLRRGTRRSR